MKRYRVVPFFLTFALTRISATHAQQTAEELYPAGLYQPLPRGSPG
jgi:hypothetical protein